MSMAKSRIVYLCVWSGDADRARDLVSSRYPQIDIIDFPRRRLRISTFKERIRLLRSLRGRAVVFYFQSIDDFKHRRILEYLHIFHRCRETVLCDRSSRWESIRFADLLRSALNVLLDIKTFSFWRVYLHFWPKRAVPAADTGRGEPEIAYLIPSPEDMGSSGGAISHIRGFLYGLKSSGRTCRVFSGSALAQEVFKNEVIDPRGRRRRYFFWEAVLLRYNFEFARGVQRSLGSSIPGAFYQRDCRFAIGGALLARRLKVPLILEYNGPQGWIADHWDPTPFKGLVRLCEEVTLRSANRIIVVSEALQAELLQRGIAADRIRVNPNAVDVDFFYPGRGRVRGRRELNLEQDEVLVGFVGSFSLWHGIEILQEAIVRLLSNGSPCRLRFVLVGDGLLLGEMRSALAAYEKEGKVIFTGPVPREKVVEYLDAADILVSPHISMPDGSRFFGSPTKIFEYMAMGKGIIASRLEQLGEVLEHDRTAWLVMPGSVEELAEAILRLALDSEKREALGSAARRAAVERHSWLHNVACALDDAPWRIHQLESLEQRVS
jgi:glycosyltransferase involved in cell wall biosynthesis